jgi:uracil DNA glycosylase
MAEKASYSEERREFLLTAPKVVLLIFFSPQHPSPFSANKGFLGNGHFKAANDWLEQKYGADGKVEWCQL